MTPPDKNIVEEHQKLIEEVLEAYPEKSKKKRSKHLNVHEEGKSDCGVKSNIKSVPGVMTARGCAYAGSKGVVWGPIKDIYNLCNADYIRFIFNARNLFLIFCLINCLICFFLLSFYQIILLIYYLII